MKQAKQKEIYNVWINQCGECNEISNITVKNFNTIEEHDKVEKAINEKYIICDDGWNSEYKTILKPNQYSGNVTINTRKYKINAEVETHKCCKCGGNY